MKKITATLLIAVLFTSCVSKREMISTANQTTNYNVKDETSATVTSGRLWILFIPIGLGPRKYEDRKAKVEQRFLNRTGADAIQNGKIVDRKIIIPLIVVSYSTHWTKLTGKPCVIAK
jgi:hypothetical protein